MHNPSEKFINLEHLVQYMFKLDEIDLRIMDILKENSKLSTHKISKKTGIPITTVYNRIKKLETEKVIKKYALILDYEKIGKHIPAYVLINVDGKVLKEKNLNYDSLTKKLKFFPEVEEAHSLTGTFDLIIKIRTENVPKLNEFLVSLRKIEGIEKTQTAIILGES